jgi:hypothetical protein
VVEWNGVAWLASVLAVIVSGLVAGVEGNARRRSGLDMGFLDHAGMWGDLILLPLANAVIVPWLTAGSWLFTAGLAATACSLGLHRWWHGGVRTAVRDHLWPDRAHGRWAHDLSWAGWCHVVYVAAELTLLFAYALTPTPLGPTLIVTAVLTIHVPIGVLQPAWFATGRVFEWNVRTMIAALALVWAVALWRV